jgi:hypothetical protein
MTTSTHRRSFWPRMAGLVAVVVLGSAWPVGAESPANGHCRGAYPCGRAWLTAFGLEYFPEKQKTMGYGDTLLFLNPDPQAAGLGHTVTHRNRSGPPLFDSGVVPAGAVAEVVGANKLLPGWYTFFCRMHPFMKNRLHVVGGSIDPVPIAP